MIRFLKTTLAAFLLVLTGLTAQTATADQIATGQFVGASDHITTGTAEIVQNADGSYSIVLGADFSLDGAPDPRVGLGKDGSYDGGTDSGALQNLTGAQTFPLPAGVDPADFNEIYIWCERFSVPLGVATFG